jgi:hypothetical protein
MPALSPKADIRPKPSYVRFLPIADAQSIVVASTATNWFGHEGSILRFVFFHSISLACLVGILVML